MEQIRLSDHFGYGRLIRFTLPTIAMMICTSIYSVIDGLFISNIVGSDAFASTNLIWPVDMILASVGFMAGSGGSALVSKTLGEGKEKLASEYFSMIIYFLIITGIILSVITRSFLPQIAQLIGASGELLDGCVEYGSILVIALPAYILECAFGSFLIADEKPKAGLAVSVICGIANLIMDFLFVYVFRMGLHGAAMATGLAELAGAVIPFIIFLRGNGTGLHFVKCRFDFAAIGKACTNGVSEMVSSISVNLVSILYNYQLLRLIGADGVVAYGIIAYVAFIFTGVYGGYSNGVAPVISYHYGAGDKDEMHSLLWHSIRLIIVISVAMALLSELLAPLQAGIFVSYDAGLTAFAANAIRLYSLSYFISGINMFASSFFTALNNGFVSALISFLRTFVFQVAAIFIMPLIFGINGIWLAVVAAEIISLAVSLTCLTVNRGKYGY